MVRAGGMSIEHGVRFGSLASISHIRLMSEGETRERL